MSAHPVSTAAEPTHAPAVPVRHAGLALHVTSLPGPHGSGDLGPHAHDFVDWLAAAGQTLWQVLPLNPPGPGDSPYQSVASLAGSPDLVSLEGLVADGWLAPPGAPPGASDIRIDHARVRPWRLARLRDAFAGFRRRATQAARDDFDGWCARESGWLDDAVLFMALDARQQGAGWWTWPAGLRDREPVTLAAARTALADEIAFQRFVQWCFDRQWRALRAHARDCGVSILGDLPIFVAHHSADVWARPDQFDLDADRQPITVTGAPPDAYSPIGQRWGHPMPRWDRMTEDGFTWWIGRLRRTLALADRVRIDHFRGFDASWAIPAGHATAANGAWLPVPGEALFGALTAVFGPLPVVAEDLGLLSPSVHALRDRFGFPGMAVVQEAFGAGPDHAFLPHRLSRRCAAYSSTHDSDTVRGWWRQASEATRAYARAYLPATDHDIHRAVLRATWQSVAEIAVATLPDLLGLGSEHRMNRPGEPTGQWAWRATPAMLADREARDWLAALTWRAGRWPPGRPAPAFA